jgi:hypothetical protein
LPFTVPDSHASSRLPSQTYAMALSFFTDTATVASPPFTRPA